MNYKDWSLRQTCEMAGKPMGALFDAALAVAIRRKGAEGQGDLKRNMLRRHQRRFFLADLKPLGLDVNVLPPAVLCARYHYLTNAISGIQMEYVEESPQKAWVRYWYEPTPLRMAHALEADRGSLEGWHSHNGESLYSIGVKSGLKVGVVMTKSTAAGDPLWEMYFKEYDHELKPDERFQFSPEPNPPDSTHYGDAYIDMLRSQVGAEEYPEERIARGQRNFWTYYAETVQEALLDIYGTAEACEILRYCWRMIAVIYAAQWKLELGIPESGAQGLALFMKALVDIQGEEAEIEQVSPKEYSVRKKTSRMFRGRLDKVSPKLFRAQNSFNEASAENLRFPTRGPKVRVQLVKSMAEGDPYFEWQISES